MKNSDNTQDDCVLEYFKMVSNESIPWIYFYYNNYDYGSYVEMLEGFKSWMNDQGQKYYSDYGFGHFKNFWHYSEIIEMPVAVKIIDEKVRSLVLLAFPVTISEPDYKD